MTLIQERELAIEHLDLGRPVTSGEGGTQKIAEDGLDLHGATGSVVKLAESLMALHRSYARISDPRQQRSPITRSDKRYKRGVRLGEGCGEAVQICAPKCSATVKISLSPRPQRLARMIASLPIVGAIFATAAMACAG